MSPEYVFPPSLFLSVFWEALSQRTVSWISDSSGPQFLHLKHSGFTMLSFPGSVREAATPLESCSFPVRLVSPPWKRNEFGAVGGEDCPAPSYLSPKRWIIFPQLQLNFQLSQNSGAVSKNSDVWTWVKRECLPHLLLPVAVIRLFFKTDPRPNFWRLGEKTTIVGKKLRNPIRGSWLLLFLKYYFLFPLTGWSSLLRLILQQQHFLWVELPPFGWN